MDENASQGMYRDGANSLPCTSGNPQSLWVMHQPEAASSWVHSMSAEGHSGIRPPALLAPWQNPEVWQGSGWLRQRGQGSWFRGWGHECNEGQGHPGHPEMVLRCLVWGLRQRR